MRLPFARVMRLVAAAQCVAVLLAGQGISRTPMPAGAQSDTGRIAFAAYVAGNWDIYSIRSDGTDLRRLTEEDAEDTSPSWSPDGTRLTFASRHGGNWDVYSLSAESPARNRLTTDPHYDGAPVFSPAGDAIAFESYRAGDLDVWMMSPDGSNQRNLTPKSQAGDFDPAWSPDGSRLAYTSWGMGDNDVFLMDLQSGATVQWTDSPRPEGNPNWLPSGRLLSFVQDEPSRREVDVAPVDQSPADGGTPFRLTWGGRDDSQAWSPDGQHLAYVSHQNTHIDSELLVVQDYPNGITNTASLPLPRVLLSGWEMAGPLSWCPVDSRIGEPAQLPAPPSPAFGSASRTGAPDSFVFLPEVTAPNAKLPSTLVESFRSLREDVLEATGRDFLRELSDMWRGIDASSDTSAYASWHKAGRAFDTLFDVRNADGTPFLEVVREETGGDTYWRIYLRAIRQDGTQGQPMKRNPWNLTGASRRKYAADGGTWKPIPYGYWVDVSDIMRRAGWERISSIDREEFSWRWHFLALEYWHHQRRDRMTWYDAMKAVYPQEVLDEEFNWVRLVRKGERAYSVLNNGIPVPPEVNWWWDIKP